MVFLYMYYCILSNYFLKLDIRKRMHMFFICNVVIYHMALISRYNFYCKCKLIQIAIYIHS